MKRLVKIDSVKLSKKGRGCTIVKNFTTLDIVLENLIIRIRVYFYATGLYLMGTLHNNA